MKDGFTLLEVVVALLILEIGLLGSLGVLVLATRTLHQAERLETVVATIEGVADSLAMAASLESGRRELEREEAITWTVTASGAFTVVFESERDVSRSRTVSGRWIGGAGRVP